MSMSFNVVDEPVYTSEPYYDLFDGGYIKPEELLSNQQDIDEVYYAVNIVQQFLDEAQEVGILEII